jgi:hypothetical protein
VAWAVIASIMVARPHFLQDELPNLVPVWKAHLATSVRLFLHMRCCFFVAASLLFLPSFFLDD